ncbi:MAG: UDP-2,4-diacetamido-2,4,6-trideoxy-beta-L-altropyranose hydrolase [Phenylobacterium sp.]
MNGPSILFVADAGPATGGGHVMRSLTLAGALAAEGAECRFAAGPAAAALLGVFAPEMARLHIASSSPQDLTQAVARERFDAIVFDHYGLAATDHQAMAKGRPALAIDDLADRALAADLVLDSGPGRRAQDYDGLVPETARLLLGPPYAPVRPAFAELREAALARRGGPIRRVLVSLGLTDVGGITGQVVERLRPRIGAAALDVVLGADAPSLAALSKIARRDERIALHVESPDMAWLMAQADIAVGAAGSTAWERCVVGLPSVMLVLAQNQRGVAGALAEREAALVVEAAAADFEAQFDRALMRLSTDAELRRRLSASSAEICDGLGAPRVAEVLLTLIAARKP